MATVVKMPKWGLTMTTGTVTGWIRDEGDEIESGDPLLTVETEKAVNDVEAPAAGVLLRILTPAGDEAAVSAAIAIIVQPGESLSESEIADLIAAAAPKKTGAARTAARTESSPRSTSRDESGRVNASPAARKLAKELGIELDGVEATGPGGRITSDDVERAAAELNDDPAAREESIAIGEGLAIAALIAGPGKTRPIVFLHGLGGSYQTWQVVLGTLAETHRVVAFDLPGHGASAKPGPESFDYSPAGLSHSIGLAIEALKLDRPILVGHSLGGAVALQLGLARGDSIAGFVLIDSAGLGPEIAPELLQLMAADPGRETARGLLKLFYEDQSLVLDRGVEDMAQSQLAAGAWTAQQAVTTEAFPNGVQSIDPEMESEKITQPALVIWGERDRVIPVKHGVDALMTLPDATLRILKAVGHVPQIEAPEAVAVAIDRFAKSLA